MKKMLIAIIGIVLCFSFCACDRKTSEKETSRKTETTTQQEKTVTESDIKDRVPGDLYSELSSKSYLKSNVDLESTRYRIGTVELITENYKELWCARGTYTLVDKYGQYYDDGKFSLCYYRDGRYASIYSSVN